MKSQTEMGAQTYRSYFHLPKQRVIEITLLYFSLVIYFLNAATLPIFVGGLDEQIECILYCTMYILSSFQYYLLDL